VASYVKRLPHIEDPDRHLFSGMMLAMDEGTVYDKPVSALDVVATIAAALEIQKPHKGFDFDGVDLIPFFN